MNRGVMVDAEISHWMRLQRRREQQDAEEWKREFVSHHHPLRWAGGIRMEEFGDVLVTELTAIPTATEGLNQQNRRFDASGANGSSSLFVGKKGVLGSDDVQVCRNATAV